MSLLLYVAQVVGNVEPGRVFLLSTYIAPERKWGHASRLLNAAPNSRRRGSHVHVRTVTPFSTLHGWEFTPFMLNSIRDERAEALVKIRRAMRVQEMSFT